MHFFNFKLNYFLVASLETYCTPSRKRGRNIEKTFFQFSIESMIIIWCELYILIKIEQPIANLIQKRAVVPSFLVKSQMVGIDDE